MMKAKVRILDNGEEITADQLALKLGISLNNARNRLTRSTDPAQVYAKKQGSSKECNESYKLRSILGRESSMYNDMFRLMLKKI
jgi:hypothetical protein